MGTWGSGNFDSDHALDYLAQVCDPLVDKLSDIVENPALAEADEDGWVECMVAVELLTVMSQYYTSQKLTPRLVTECRDTLLTEWSATIDELDPTPDYKAGREVVLQQSFDKLLAIVAGRQRAA